MVGRRSPLSWPAGLWCSEDLFDSHPTSPAEAVRFELTDVLRHRRFSRPVHSTALPRFRPRDSRPCPACAQNRVDTPAVTAPLLVSCTPLTYW
jgi:hypothetical protein